MLLTVILIPHHIQQGGIVDQADGELPYSQPVMMSRLPTVGRPDTTTYNDFAVIHIVKDTALCRQAPSDTETAYVEPVDSVNR